ncbi:hypothetical protein NQ314_008165 [Rhamnusium bicolor]|uniref:Transposase n=1 Tax=Rhamnusium bicolor TaxID=1586634 RepID=A0AAV8YEK2_9CUCU|nr:hypothetical protein NQ314_008165 [Rhamnusium bicolor]
MAGTDWMKSFMRRHTTLSLRKPENTSIARIAGFNKESVEEFYSNLEQVLRKYKFSPRRIFNLDETGVTTVLPSPKVVAEKGKRQVGQVTSAERGSLVTVVCIVNAIGNFISPCLIFPRQKYLPHFIEGAPYGTLGLASKSGWMTASLFVEVLHHIKKTSTVQLKIPSC